MRGWDFSIRDSRGGGYLGLGITRTPRGINRLVRHGFPPSFFVLLAPVTYLMIHKKRIRISECLCLRYSAFARLRQVRLPFSYRREWDGFRKGVDLPEKRIFCIIKQGKKTREVTSPGPWPLIIGTYRSVVLQKNRTCESDTIQI